MSATAVAPRGAPPAPPALPGPYARPPSPDALRPDPATVALVRDQVQALLLSSPAFHRIAEGERRKLAHNLVKVAAYAAECVRDDWYQSERRLGQRPLVLRKEHMTPAPQALASAQAAGASFTPGAASKVGSVTKQTLNAIAFPTFVSELIRGTFDAITSASVKQMEDYGRLLGNVGRNVDDFMNRSVSDNQARDWLVERYPLHLRVELPSAGSTAKRAKPARPGRPERRSRGSSAAPQAALKPVDGAEDRKLPNWKEELGVGDKPSLDESWLEEKLVPAARRAMAQSRLQTLSAMVLMGMDRIQVTGGKLRATMAFHIDASDFGKEQHASDMDTRVAAAGSVGGGWWTVSASASFAYVTSTRTAAQSELNVAADLGGEVEIHFKSAPFPLERMAGPSAIGRIVANTAVPESNVALSSTGETIPWGTSAPTGPAVVPTRERKFDMTPAGTPIGEAKVPVKPTAPEQPAKLSDDVARDAPGGKYPPGSKQGERDKAAEEASKETSPDHEHEGSDGGT